MPRRSVFSASERDSLLVIPNTQDELIRYYTLSELDLSIIRQHRGAENRLGFAVQLCYMRYPGVMLNAEEKPDPLLLRLVANQLQITEATWSKYGQRDKTRREHLVELQSVFGFQAFTRHHYRDAVHALDDLAWQTDKGIVLGHQLLVHLRHQSILLPSLNVIDRICSEAITRSNQSIYRALTEQLSDEHRQRLDDLLQRKPESQITWLAWLRQSPAKPNSRHMLEHIERLKTFHAIDLPKGIDRQIHQNRLLKIAREGGQMTPADLSRFELLRRYATLVALTLEGTATVTDEIIDLHDRIIGKLFNAAKNRHEQKFQESGKAINDKVLLYGKIGQALLTARQNGGDAFAAIESVMSWEAFASSVTDAEKLAQPEDFDYLHRLGESYSMLRRYAPAFLGILKLRAAPAAQDMLDAIEVIRTLNSDNSRKVPSDAPTAFIKKRWEKLVFSDEGIDRRYYEFCAMSIAMRILQGIGTAMMVPVGRLTVIRTFPKSELLHAMNFVIIPALIGPLLGPTVGGLIVHWLSWRDIFFVNVPVGLIALFLIYRYMPNYRGDTQHPLDVTGIILFGSGTALLSWILEIFGEYHADSSLILALFGLSLGLLGAYVWHARHKEYPLLNLSLFKIRTFRVSVVGGFVTRLGIGGLPFLMPLLYQLGLGLPAWHSGLLMMPTAAAAMGMKLISEPVLKRYGYRKVLIFNTLMIGVVIISFASVTPETSQIGIILRSLALGFFNSLQFSSMNSMAYADIASEDSSMASSIFSSLQQISLSFGLACGSLVAAWYLHGLPQSDQTAVLHALHHAFIVMGGITILSALFFRTLRARDGENVSHARVEEDA